MRARSPHFRKRIFTTRIRSLSLLPWVAFNLIAAPKPRPGGVDCSRMMALLDTATPRPSRTEAALRGALQRLRLRTGKVAPLTLEQFDTHTRDLTLFLLGKKGPSDLASNRFFSHHSEKIDIETALRSLHDEEAALIHAAVNKAVEHHLETLTYGGKTTQAAIAQLADSTELTIFTHQIPPLQKSASARPGVWLIGTESAHPLAETALNTATLIRHSVGGEIDFALPRASIVNVAGGAVDQCLVQTIRSVASHTQAPALKIRVLMPVTYFEGSRRLQESLSTLVDSRSPLLNAIRSQTHQEIAEHLKDDQFTRTSPLTPARDDEFLAPITFTNPAGRTLHIEFVR